MSILAIKKGSLFFAKTEEGLAMGSTLDQMIDAAVFCTKCGAKPGQCDCWTKCSCGWFAEKGKPCRNPDTKRCSTKVRYGKYNRSTRRYE